MRPDVLSFGAMVTWKRLLAESENVSPTKVATIQPVELQFVKVALLKPLIYCEPGWSRRGRAHHPDWFRRRFGPPGAR
jgi:hypothetical protein